MGTLTKQIYRYTHPRNMRHNENLWPYVKIKRDGTGAISDLFYKGQRFPLVNLSELKHSFSGEVLLIATGPSINNIDFSLIPDLPAAGVNGAWHLSKRLDFKLYVIVDMIFIDNQHELLKEIVAKKNIILFTTMHGIVRLANKFSPENICCCVAVIEDKCFPIYQPTINRDEVYNKLHAHKDIDFSSENKNIAFSHDIRTGIFDAGTVVYWTLQILAFLGFKKIYVAGLDMNNFSSPRFYENPNSMLPSFLENKLQDIIIPAFKLASNSLKQVNIEVINLSIESAIPAHIFSKMDYRDVFK